MPTIEIDNRQTDLNLDQEWMKKISLEVMDLAGLPEYELSVSLVSEEEMTELHVKYYGEDGPTDVLAFPLLDSLTQEGTYLLNANSPPNTNSSPNTNSGADRMLGDVVICPNVIRQSKTETTKAEIVMRLIHGILHLAGYDHDTPEAEKEMFSLTNQIMEEIDYGAN